MWFKKKDIEEDFLTKETIKELNKLEKEKIDENSIKELNRILRIFLKERYKISQGLTVEEVIIILKEKSIKEQIKLNISAIIQEFYKEEYGLKIIPSREQFNNYINQMKILVLSTDKNIKNLEK